MTTTSKQIESPEKVTGIYAVISENARDVASEIYQTIESSPLDVGGIMMVTGPEKSGKTVVAIDLADMILESDLGDRSVLFGQPEVDRADVPKDRMVSRIGREIPAVSFESKSDIEKMFHEHEVVIVDEIQFVPYEIQSYLLQEIVLFVERGGFFIGLGLDYTSQGGEFIFTALLKSRAQKVFRLSSLCQMCGKKADKYCQRLINGVPASVNTPAFLSPSENVSYEPRCEECFVVKK